MNQTTFGGISTLNMYCATGMLANTCGPVAVPPLGDFALDLGLTMEADPGRSSLGS